MIERGEMKTPVLAWCLGFACVTGVVLADEGHPSLKDALKELEAAHDRNPGYMVVYEGKGKDASLEYQMAVDRVSDLTVSRLVLINGDERSQCRIWNTGDDRWYFETDNELRIARGISEEIASLMELVRKVTKAEAEIPKTSQSLLLERGGFRRASGSRPARPRGCPRWRNPPFVRPIRTRSLLKQRSMANWRSAAPRDCCCGSPSFPTRGMSGCWN